MAFGCCEKRVVLASLAVLMGLAGHSAPARWEGRTPARWTVVGSVPITHLAPLPFRPCSPPALLPPSAVRPAARLPGRRPSPGLPSAPACFCAAAALPRCLRRPRCAPAFLLPLLRLLPLALPAVRACLLVLGCAVCGPSLVPCRRLGSWVPSGLGSLGSPWASAACSGFPAGAQSAY